MICNVKDLSPDQKLATESVIGETLSEQDSMIVRRLGPVAQISDARRRKILTTLEAISKRRRKEILKPPRVQSSHIDAQLPLVSEDEADTSWMPSATTAPVSRSTTCSAL